MRKPKAPKVKIKKPNIKKPNIRQSAKYIIESKSDAKDDYTAIEETEKKPFDFTNRPVLRNRILAKYGPGYYRIVQIDPRTKKESICFVGEVEHPTRGKQWTRAEREEHTRNRRQPKRLKVTMSFLLAVIFVALLVTFFYSIATVNVPLMIGSFVVLVLMTIFSFVLVDIAFFGTE